MPCRDASLIVGSRSGCIGCPCALALSYPGLGPERDAFIAKERPGPGDGFRAGETPMRAAGSRPFAQAALLVFGVPLLLLLLSAAAAAAFSTNQPLWGLAGMAFLPGIVARLRPGLGNAHRSRR